MGKSKFDIQVDRNMKGIEFEKVGHEEAARLLYEQNLVEAFEGSHPYERLRVIYTRRKDYENAIRACESFIRISRWPEKKTLKFQAHADKLRSKV